MGTALRSHRRGNIALVLRAASSAFLFSLLFLASLAPRIAFALNSSLEQVASDMKATASALRQAEASTTEDNFRSSLIRVAADLEIGSIELRQLNTSASFDGTLTVTQFVRYAVLLQRTRDLYESDPIFPLERIDTTIFEIAKLLISNSHLDSQFRVLAVTPFRISPSPDPGIITAIVSPLDADPNQSHVTVEGIEVHPRLMSPGVWQFAVSDAARVGPSRALSLSFRGTRSLLMFTVSSVTVERKLFLNDRTPFVFTLQVRKRDAAIATVPAKISLIIRADSSNPTVLTSLSATQLFSQLVNDDSTYYADSALILDTAASVRVGGKPCSDCPDARGTYDWAPDHLTVHLTAPICQGHVVGGSFHLLGYVCGGGGSNVELHANPVFSVRRRATSTDGESVQSLNVSLPRESSDYSLNLPVGWTSVTLDGSFADGVRSHAEQATVSPITSEGEPASKAWAAKVDKDVLRIITH